MAKFVWRELINGFGKRVAFVNPPFYGNRRWGIRAGSRWPYSGDTPNYGYCPYPHFLGYGAAYVESLGYCVMFYDAVAWRHDFDTFYNALEEFKPEIIFQEISTPSFYLDMDIAKTLSEIAEVCLVGAHATTFAEELLDNDYISYVIKGPYEKGAEEILKIRVDGVYGRYSAINPDVLPYPVRADYMIRDRTTNFTQVTGKNAMYYDPLCKRDINEPMLFVNASRGCPYVCDFCLWTNVMYDNKCKLRNVDNVINEIKYCVENFGYRYVYFDDDTWNVGGEKRLMYFCQEMKKLNIPWSMMGRIDGCSRDMWEMIVYSNCVGLRVGVETVSQKQLERMGKQETADQIKNTVRWMKTLDADLFLCCMHGYPGETEEDRKATNDFIKEIGHNNQNPQCIPFPGTPFYNNVVERGFTCDDWSEYDAGKLGKNLKDGLANLL